MIKVRIYNCPDLDMRKKIRHAAKFFLAALLPRKKRLDIRIFIKKDLFKNEKMVGSCTADDYAVNNRHFEFTICIDEDLNLKERLSILAHEMTHVKQYATGQLLYDDADPKVSIWEGVRYDDSKIAYSKQLWEKDAKKYEVSLLKDLMKTVDWI